MNDILQQIVEATRRDLALSPIDVVVERQNAVRVTASKTPHSFRDALSGGVERAAGRAARIIAEIKCASPSAGIIVADPAVEEIARDYKAGGAAALSVVTEPHFFQGSRSWLERASGAASLPVVMKDFIVEEAQLHRAIACGADAVLLLASLLDAAQLADFIGVLSGYQRDALVEVHDERELELALEAGASIIGVNNRDLRDFSVSLTTSERLVRGIPEEALRVSESGIREAADIDRLLGAGFDAFLVGESLLRQDDRTSAVQMLLGASGRGGAE